jgi:predicted DNA-binding protein with PD1-like motif
MATFLFLTGFSAIERLLPRYVVAMNEFSAHHCLQRYGAVHILYQIKEQTMKYEIGKPGRVIVARLEENDPIYQSIEDIAAIEQVNSAVFWIIGGVKNVKVVTGPEDHRARPLNAIVDELPGVQEILGTGTIFPNAKGEPKIHMHASFGHDSHTVTGCPRINLDCWLISEIVIQEITGVEAKRLKESSGYELLTIGGNLE